MNLQYIADIIDRQVAQSLSYSKDVSDNELRETINKCADDLFRRVNISDEDKAKITLKIFNGRRRYGVIQPYLEDMSVNEIMINGTNDIFIEKGGKIVNTNESFRSVDALYNVIQSMAALSNRTVNESMPIVDGRLEDGSRLNAVLSPVALNGPCVTIRKFPDRSFTPEDMVNSRTCTADEMSFLERAVKSGFNIFVSGGTSTGKTTFLNVLSVFIPPEERVITIEDSAELRMSRNNLVQLETKNANAEGIGGVTMRELIKTSLRMRPDRIIVGEVRDQSALDMLQAMCTGHDGSMSTGHANSPADMLMRLETMSLWEGHINSEAIKRQISAGLDLIVQLRRDKNMKRYVDEITEVGEFKNGAVELNPIFVQGKKVGEIRTRGFKLVRRTA